MTVVRLAPCLEHTMTHFLSDRMPLVIGVTGHRDLRDQDIPLLEQAVASVITGLRRDFLDGDVETPIIVLSGLAEGGDRVAARVALAQGAQLIAALPMPLDEYRRDFEPGLQPGNLAEFEQLFARAIAAPVMPLNGVSIEALRGDEKKRTDQYRALGMFIARHCHVLLALWDGNEEGMSPGGSAEVVTFKRDGIPLKLTGSVRESLDTSEIGPVIEILTPRMKNAHAFREVAVMPWGKNVLNRHQEDIMRRAWNRVAAAVANIFGRELERQQVALDGRELDSWKKFETLVGLNQEFNRDASLLLRREDAAARLAQSLDSLFSDYHADALDHSNPKKHVGDVAPLWCRFHCIADALSQERQRQFKRDWKLLFMGGLVAFIWFASFAHAGFTTTLEIATVLLAGYFLSLLAVLVLFARAVRQRHQERYLDYRALAEALRVAVFWKLLGIGSRHVSAMARPDNAPRIDINPVRAIADAYPIQEPGELAWVKVCLRTLEGMDKPQGGLGEPIDPIGHAIARQFWVFGQSAWYRRQGSRHEQFVKWNELRSTTLLVISLFVCVPILFYLLLTGTPYHWLPQGIILLVGLLPGVAAALTGYSERMAFKAQARQYDRMRMLFERAYKLLPPDVDEEMRPLAYAVYHELGVEAMNENAEWVAIYRQRPIRPPQ
jgi:hypothetical protein